MKKIRTEQFFKTSYTSMGIGAAFLAALSFLIFSFLPYFHGDRRWFAIPTLLTAVFVLGTAMLWQFPAGGI